MPLDICRLCQKQAELQHSHILPAFVIRWLRESSGTGHIRLGTEPNQRVQDGVKRYWLCATCEGHFNRFETAFATNLFYPYLEAPGKQLPYSSWLIHFCTSISWRILRLYLDENLIGDWGKDRIAHIIKAERIWREFLLGSRRHPEAFQQHLLPLDRIETAAGELAPNINRYLMRAIDMDICRGSKTIFTYAKLGRFIVLGFVHEPNPNRWRGTKVNTNKGLVEPKQYVLPQAFMVYLNQKARRVEDLLDSASDKQQAKMDAAFQQNVGRYMKSDDFQAMLADLSMFGNKAYSRRSK